MRQAFEGTQVWFATHTKWETTSGLQLLNTPNLPLIRAFQVLMLCMLRGLSVYRDQHVSTLRLPRGRSQNPKPSQRAEAWPALQPLWQGRKQLASSVARLIGEGAALPSLAKGYSARRLPSLPSKSKRRLGHRRVKYKLCFTQKDMY